MDSVGFIAKLIEVTTSGDWLSLVVVIVFILISQAKRIIDSFDYIRDRKIRAISSLQTLDEISEETEYVLKQSVDQIAFARVTGISTNEKGRKKITAVLKQADGTLSVLGLRQINSYVRPIKGEITVPVSAIDYIEALWSLLTLFVIVIFLVSVCIGIFKTEQATWAMGMVGVALISLSFVLSLLPLRTILVFLRALDARGVFKKYEDQVKAKQG